MRWLLVAASSLSLTSQFPIESLGPRPSALGSLSQPPAEQEKANGKIIYFGAGF